MQKRLDTLVTSFQTQLKDITDDYDDRILKMRERYDLVIREAREERADDARDFMAVRAKIHEQITARLEAINTKLDQLMARQR
jgi:ribosome-binding protein aMBF1 (putative translation factor)